MKPRLFIGSSVEHLNLAYAVQENLEHEVEPTVWSQGVFAPSRMAMASLLDQIEESDFGLFIFSPDDITTIRDQKKQTVRDNVVFELGLFVGRLGYERCFIVVPKGHEDLRLPTDLTGMTPASFDPDRQDGNLQAALGPACNRILRSIKKHGLLSRLEPNPGTIKELNETEAVDAPYDDPDDCVAIIQSWMGSRPRNMNTKAIDLAELDLQLKMKAGSARLYIEKAAERYGYVAEMKGKRLIRFGRKPLVDDF